MSKLVKLNEAATQLGISIAALRDWRLRRRHLDFVKVGRAVRIPQKSIDKLIAHQTIKPGLGPGQSRK